MGKLEMKQMRADAWFARGHATALLLLQNVIEVFGPTFTYHRRWNDDSGGIVLEFTAEVEGKLLHGVDIIELDANDQITRFEVMVRPYSSLLTLRTLMGERLMKSKM